MNASESAVLPTVVAEPIEKGNSLWHDAWLRLRKNKLAVFGMWALGIITVACVAGPWISAYGYEQQDLSNTFAPPGARHWLGTDQLGRDLLVRLLYGGRISLGVGLAATFVALTIGVIYGAVAGFFGGKLDAFAKAEEEALGTYGSACEYPTVRVQVMAYRQQTMDTLRKDGKLQAVGGVGDEAYVRNNGNRFAELYARAGPHLLTLQLGIDARSSFETAKPSLVELARAFIARLR